jgi:hypothetical protein
LANFVGSVVSFLNVLIIRLRSILLAAALSVEIEWYKRERSNETFAELTLPEEIVS